MREKEYGPISGSGILGGISGRKTIIMAANTRITTVAKGIFKAAKDTDSAVFVELARSECNLRGVFRVNPPGFLRKNERGCKGSTV
jgi:fructose-bisphosphate aldolase class II